MEAEIAADVALEVASAPAEVELTERSEDPYAGTSRSRAERARDMEENAEGQSMQGNGEKVEGLENLRV